MQQDRDKSEEAVVAALPSHPVARVEPGVNGATAQTVAGTGYATTSGGVLHSTAASVLTLGPSSMAGTAGAAASPTSSAGPSAVGMAAAGHSYSPETLARIQAQKKRNHAIRVQEFALLRQLRQQLPGMAQAEAAAVAVASGGGDSASADSTLSARVGATLQKINAIEAQLARQWWRAKPAEAASPAHPHAAESVLGPAGASATVGPAAGGADGPRPDGISPAQWQFIPTLGVESVVAAAPAVQVQQPGWVGMYADAEPVCVVPEVEDAAILFAHGDLDAAKASLLQLLVQALDAQPPDPVRVADIWRMVLDLYRATDDAEGFEALAWDYAAHFACAVPQWYSLSERYGIEPIATLSTRESAADTPASPPGPAGHWHAPEVLGLDAVLALDAVVMMRPMPWRLNWTALRQMEPVVLPLLCRVLEGWLRSGGEFVCTGVSALRKVLEQHTGVGQRAESSQWWSLHLSVLRWLNLPEAFEQVALNYCVTYEVSPPQWQEADAVRVVHTEGEAQGGRLQGVLPRTAQGPAALLGSLAGDITALLEPLEAHAREDEALEIDCEALVRMDLVAVASLLQWCAQRHGQGRRVRFIQVRSWITVLWQLMGLSAFARIQMLVSPA